MDYIRKHTYWLTYKEYMKKFKNHSSQKHTHMNKDVKTRTCIYFIYTPE